MPFAPEGDVAFIILDNKETFPLLLREIVALFSKAAHYTNILEKIV